jgi:thiamine biosynthesis lipoprotein
MMKITRRFVLLLAGLCVCTAGAVESRAAEPRAVTFKTRTMGTEASLVLVTPDSAAVADLAYRALLSLHHTDSLMTNWTETSETARINRLAGTTTVQMQPEVNRVLIAAGEVGRESGGAFDITVEPLVRLWGFLGGEPAVPTEEAIATALAPVGWQQLEHDAEAGTIRFSDPATRIDLGGVAKGYGVDRVGEILHEAGVTDALINLSGNMIALGAPPNRTSWTLRIMDPEKRHDYLGRISLHNQAVATSGNDFQYVMNEGQRDSRRYGHILDPRTGWPADGMASATVIAPDATTADAWATAFVVMETWRARSIARDHDELHVVLVEQAAGNLQMIWVEEILRENFVLKEGLPETIKVIYF